MMPNPFNQTQHEDDMREKHTIQTGDERGGWTSASSAEADSLCPGRHLAQKGIAETDPGEDASRGSRIHAALEVGNPTALVGDEVDCYEQLAGMEQQSLASWGNRDEVYDCRREERIWIDLGNCQHSGKPDVVYVDAVDGRAIVLDYKTGRADVIDSPNNLQLRDLAVLVARKHLVSEITVAILQPFKGIVQTTYVVADLLKALQEQEERVLASNNPTSQRIPGSVQCKYCRGRAACPEFLAQALPVPVQEADPVAVKAGVLSLSSGQLGHFLALVRLAEETATAEVRSRIEAGGEVSGWQIKPGRETERISDPQTVFTRSLEMGISQAAFVANCITVGKTALKAELKTATGAKGKALDGAMLELLAGCTETKVSAPVLTQTKEAK